MFTRNSQNGKIIVLTGYVDDITFTRDYISEMKQSKSSLSSTFEIKYSGSLRHFLNMGITRSKNGIVLLTKVHP